MNDECGCLFYFLIAETLKYMEFFFWIKILSTNGVQRTQTQS